MKYGINYYDVDKVITSMDKTKSFLMGHYLQDSNGEKYQLINYYKSAYINTERYIAELQHRVWSYYNYAQEQELETVFLTLTLPSEYHRQKQQNGRLVNNPKFAHRQIKLYDTITHKRAISYTKPVIKYYKTLGISKHNGKFLDISLLKKDYKPRSGIKQLTKLLSKLRHDRSFKGIPKDKRPYFRMTEPHKDGTPHVHVAFFMPKEYIENFIKAIQRLYPNPQSDVASTFIPSSYKEYQRVYRSKNKYYPAYKQSENSKDYIRLQISNTVSYLMKYIYKTLDDMRNGANVTELSVWYLANNICRFYTSRTLISLNIYRALNGRMGLLELTKSYESDELTVYLDTETKKPMMIELDGNLLWNKKHFELKEYDSSEDLQKRKDRHVRPPVITIPVEIDGEEFYMFKGSTTLYQEKRFQKNNIDIASIPIPSRMNSYQLYNYYHALDLDDPSINLAHFGHVQNLLIEQNILDDISIQSLNDFNTKFEYKEVG